jgi:hypothetical protein
MARASWRRRTIAFWADGWTGFSIGASQVKTAAVKQLCAGTGVRRLANPVGLRNYPTGLNLSAIQASCQDKKQDEQSILNPLQHFDLTIFVLRRYTLSRRKRNPWTKKRT